MPIANGCCQQNTVALVGSQWSQELSSKSRILRSVLVSHRKVTRLHTLLQLKTNTDLLLQQSADVWLQTRAVSRARALLEILQAIRILHPSSNVIVSQSATTTVTTVPSASLLLSLALASSFLACQMVSNFHLDSSCPGLRQRSPRHLEPLECPQCSLFDILPTSSMAFRALFGSSGISIPAFEDRLAHQTGEQGDTDFRSFSIISLLHGTALRPIAGLLFCPLSCTAATFHVRKFHSILCKMQGGWRDLLGQ